MARLLASRHHCDGQLLAIGVRTSSSRFARSRSAAMLVRPSSTSIAQYRPSASAPSTYDFCANNIRLTSACSISATGGPAGGLGATRRPRVCSLASGGEVRQPADPLPPPPHPPAPRASLLIRDN